MLSCTAPLLNDKEEGCARNHSAWPTSRLGTPYNGIQEKGPPQCNTFVKLQVYERVGISIVEACEMVGKTSFRP